jgi:O-antigen/teichoic acid export membrane protein
MSRPPGVGKNVLSTAAAQLISWAVTYVVNIYLPRYLGSVGNAHYTYVSSAVGILGAVVLLGLPHVLTRDIPRTPERTSGMMRRALAIVLLSSALAAVGMLVSAHFLRWSEERRLLLLPLSATLVTTAANEIFAAVWIGREFASRQSAMILLDKFVSSALVIACIFFGGALWTVGLSFLVTQLVVAAANATLQRDLLLSRINAPPTSAKALLTAGLPFLGWVACRKLYGQTDPIILDAVADLNGVSWYGVAARLVFTTLFLPVAVMQALLPTLSRLHSEGATERLSGLARRALEMSLVGAAPFAIILMTLSEPLLGLLHYGPQFAGAAPVLRLGGIAAVCYFAASVFGTLLTATNRQNALLHGAIGAIVLGIPGCIAGSWLTHRLLGNGAIGAMGSDIVREVGLIVWYLWALPRGLFGRETLLWGGRWLLCGLGCAAVCLAAAPRLGFWACVPGVAVYAAAALALKVIDRSLIETLRRVRSGGGA